MQLTLQQLQPVLTSAIMTADATVTGLTTDSRKITAGDLFVALRGDHFDAHDFLAQVAGSGAVAVVAERVPEHFALPALIVPDTKLALAEIGRYWRQQFMLPVIGVTGSNGKTTVKEMISSILAAAFGAEHRLATSGNLNNEIGVPLTILGLNTSHRAAVIEMGMNHPGEIALLASVAQPTVVLVNNAQREHQEFMQTVQAVAEENGAAIKALPDDGVAVIPAEDEYCSLWQRYAAERGQRKVIRFGFNNEAEVNASFIATPFGSEVNMHIAGRSSELRLQAAGQHNVLNALAAAACCHAIGISDELIVAGLENFSPVNGRLQRKQASCGAMVIDDTYNANPDSVRAAIDVLTQIGGATVLVLGDMGEVGENGAQFHKEIGEYAKAQGVTELYLLGDLVAHTATAYASAHYFTDIQDLFRALDSSIHQEKTVLVKGSRFMKMERVVSHLLVADDGTSTQQKITGTH
ncbi:UDP-N-acetylmuramoyl-tripeptide--D-alanyl-D-alanine ligase [Undibacterium sp. FT147W]|uniref:UDP-N-acetylmuramoyl-tripeptide--D-alanyl-D-alanine ligase n=1 Tax=Undibacterium rivi TaxID=2828729 RepID=A0ABS5GYS5_9BURK|nr:UDP-N-acetylmuramoyl-tripeptide--D-alanyl-D-alanine ligase [Undibacterium rivi]MBR7791611.1 UDP-N-acetylmuramoyl-tripeptide--D-alanyl-D-alanine ligase [Undibacterium rivi]